MRGRILVFAFCGTFFSGTVYILCDAFRLVRNPFPAAVLSGLLFTFLLYPCLLLSEKHNAKKYRELEKDIVSLVFYQTNGNFNLGDRVRNGNIYFCEDGILFALLDAKPAVLEELPVQKIDSFQFDGVYLVIHTVEEMKYIITAADVSSIREALIRKGWIH